MVGSPIITPISEEKVKVQEGSDLTRTPAVARPGWKSVTFFQDCFIEPLLWARASAKGFSPLPRTASLHVKASKLFASTWTHFSFSPKPS